MMNPNVLTMDPAEAQVLYRKYKEHLHYSQPVDHEIMRIYQLIARGKVVIKALESIVHAGLNTDGLPKLAIVRATAERCHLREMRVGGCVMSQRIWHQGRERPDTTFSFPAGSFPGIGEGHSKYRYEAITPIIPLHQRPARGLANYHVLWEAEWGPAIPVDPMLIRRIGKADAWLVVAAWDLTEVERAVMAGRQ